MASFRTEGLILKRSDFGEADRILTVFTKKKGKIKALARGVRRMESRKGGNVELLNLVTFFLAEGREMDTVLEVETKNAFQPIKEDLITSGYAYHIVELLDRLLPEREPHPEILTLAVETLTWMTKRPRQIAVRAFEIKLMRALGFWSRSQIHTDAALLQIIEILEEASWEEIFQIDLTKPQAVELSNILEGYLESILESSLRSKKFIQKIKRG